MPAEPNGNYLDLPESPSSEVASVHTFLDTLRDTKDFASHLLLEDVIRQQFEYIENELSSYQPIGESLLYRYRHTAYGLEILNDLYLRELYKAFCHLREEPRKPVPILRIVQNAFTRMFETPHSRMQREDIRRHFIGEIYEKYNATIETATYIPCGRTLDHQKFDASELSITKK